MINTNESHQRALAKEREMEKLKSALKVKDGY
jgi:hypothetical protein